MRDRLAARLDELRRDYEAGQGQLRQLAQQEAALRETLLRISGAIQVLEELQTHDQAGPADGATRGPAGGSAAGSADGSAAASELSVT